MPEIDIAKELNKYSKEAIILTMKNSMFFRTNNILNEVRFNEQRLLIDQIDSLNAEMAKISTNTRAGLIKWNELNEKWHKLDSKLDKLMKIK